MATVNKTVDIQHLGPRELMLNLGAESWSTKLAELELLEVF